MKILFVFGTRPEAIKLAPLVDTLSNDCLFDIKICVTAQHRQMLDQVLKIFSLVPDYDLNLMTANQNLSDITSKIITQVGAVIDHAKPDRIIVQGDTTTAMAAAMAAFYRKIPVDHVEAGLRSGDIYSPWPEELNRKVISSIACFHFAPTEQAADALLRENISKDNVFITGNTVIDALLTTKKRADKFGWLHDAIDGKFMAHNTHKRSILVTTHRRENLESGIKGILSAIKHLSRRDDTAIIFPVHPNPKIKDQANAELSNNSNVLLLPPLDYLPFVRILSQCHFVLTDSGGIQEEAPAFGKPVLIMRNTTERPEGISAGTALLVGTCAQRITMEATRLLEDEAHYNRMSRAHNPFGDGQASLKIRDILKRTQISHTSSKLGALQYAS